MLTKARRALTILREQGPVDLWWKLVGELGYRRVILFERPLGTGAQPKEPPPPIELGELREDEVDAFLAFNPESSRPEVERRMRANDRCHVARDGERLVSARWVSLSEGRVAYLRLAFPLGEGEAFFYDAYTVPEWRRRGVAGAVSAAMIARLEADGFTKLLSAALPENPEGLALGSSTSAPAEVLVSVGFGRRRRHFRRPVDA